MRLIGKLLHKFVFFEKFYTIQLCFKKSTKLSFGWKVSPKKEFSLKILKKKNHLTSSEGLIQKINSFFFIYLIWSTFSQNCISAYKKNFHQFVDTIFRTVNNNKVIKVLNLFSSLYNIKKFNLLKKKHTHTLAFIIIPQYGYNTLCR